MTVNRIRSDADSRRGRFGVPLLCLTAVLTLLPLDSARGQPLQTLAHLGDSGMACRDADEAALRLVRPLVATDRAIDTRVLKIVVTSLDLARDYCAQGWTDEGTDIYQHLTYSLARYTRDGVWPLE